MTKQNVLSAVLVILSMMIAGVAFAADDNPCKKDIGRFCKGIEPGDGQILRCLTLSEKNLTPPCKKHLARIEKAVEEVQNACADDYALYCSSVLPGQGRIAGCLEKNEKFLTPKCKSVLSEVKKKARTIQEQMKQK